MQLLEVAHERGAVDLDRVRVDTTVVTADIKYPTDSGLLTSAIGRRQGWRRRAPRPATGQPRGTPPSATAHDASDRLAATLHRPAATYFFRGSNRVLQVPFLPLAGASGANPARRAMACETRWRTCSGVDAPGQTLGTAVRVRAP